MLAFPLVQASQVEAVRSSKVVCQLPYKLQLGRVYAAAQDAQVARLLRWKQKVVKHDHNASLQDLSAKIQYAEDRGDTASSFRIVQTLAGKPLKPLKGVKHEDGHLLNSEAEIAQRWLRHHASVLSAAIVSPHSQDGACAQKPPEHQIGSFWPCLFQVFREILSLDGKCGLGPDQLSAVYFKLAPWPVARFLHYIITRCILEERLPEN